MISRPPLTKNKSHRCVACSPHAHHHAYTRTLPCTHSKPAGIYGDITALGWCLILFVFYTYLALAPASVRTHKHLRVIFTLSQTSKGDFCTIANVSPRVILSNFDCNIHPLGVVIIGHPKALSRLTSPRLPQRLTLNLDCPDTLHESNLTAIISV